MKYNALRQNVSTFRIFFIEFIRLDSEIDKSDNDLRKNLQKKINFRLYDRLTSFVFSKRRNNLKDLKKFFMHYDDNERIRALQNEAEKVTKLKAFISTRKAITYVISSHYSIIITTEIEASASQAKNININDSEYKLCYNYNKPDHIARNYSNPSTKAEKSTSKTAKTYIIKINEKYKQQRLKFYLDSRNN